MIPMVSSAFMDCISISFDMSIDKRTIKYNVMLLTLSNMTLQGIGFIYRMMLAELAGAEAMGLNSLVMQIYSMAVSVCISGMNVAVVTLSARQLPNGSGAIRRLVRMAFGVYLALYFAMAIPVFIARDAIARHLIGDAGIGSAISLVLICIFMTGIENLLKSVHLGTNRARITAISEIIEQSARLVFVFLLLKRFATGGSIKAVEIVLAGMIMSEFFSVGTLLCSYRKNYICCGKSLPSNEHLLTLQTYSSILAPAGFTAIASTVFEAMASLLLPGRLEIAGYTRSAALAAIGTLNGVAAPLVSMPMCFIAASNNILMPKIAEAMGECDNAKLRFFIKRSLLSSCAAILFVNLPLLPFTQKLSELCFNVQPARGVFLLLTIKYAIIYFQVTVAMILNGMMMQKTILRYAIMGELLQLLLIYLLSANPFLHIYGYLAAMIIGEGIRLVLSLAAVKKGCAGR